jgi:hypothetical protein
MSLASFFTGIEGYAAKGEAELNTLLTAAKALDAALTAANTATPSLVVANALAGLKVLEAFIQMAITDTTPFVSALQSTVTALSTPPAATTSGH